MKFLGRAASQLLIWFRNSSNFPPPGANFFVDDADNKFIDDNGDYFIDGN